MINYAYFAHLCLIGKGVKMSVGSRLIEIRKAAAFTQADFAKKLEISPRAYTSYELGHRDLPLMLIIKLHQLFSINANWLILGEGSRESEDVGGNVELAVIAALEYLTERQIEVSPEKTAKMIRHLFNYQKRSGEISPGYRNDYMSSAI